MILEPILTERRFIRVIRMIVRMVTCFLRRKGEKKPKKNLEN